MHILGFFIRFILSFILSFCLIFTPCLYTLPKKPQVQKGQATWQSSKDQFTIQVTGDGIIHYETFDIQRGETVRFIQSSPQARVLNRVMGMQASQIYGNLLSNGQVYLVNPAGIYLGKTALVDVAGLWAIAGQMSNQDFLSGINRFTSLYGSVVNEGLIRSNFVHLLGDYVSNIGSIVASEGLVSMLAGNQVLLGHEDSPVFVEVDKGDLSPSGSATPNKKVGVDQIGEILAKKGSVMMGAADVFAVSLHKGSFTDADHVKLTSESGEITLDGKLRAKKSLSISTKSSLNLAGEVISEGKTEITVGDIHLTGSIKAKNASIHLRSSKYKPIAIGDAQASLTLSEKELRSLRTSSLVVGDRFAQEILVGSISKESSSGIQSLSLLTGPKGSIHFKGKKPIQLKELIAQAGQRILVENEIQSMEKGIHLQVGSSDVNNDEGIILFDGGKLNALKDIVLSSSKVSFKDDVTIESKKDIQVGVLGVEQKSLAKGILQDLQEQSLQVRADGNIMIYGDFLYEGDLHLFADADKDQVGQLFLDMERSVEVHGGDLFLHAHRLENQGSFMAEGAIHLKSSSGALQLGGNPSEPFYISSDHLKRIQTKQLTIGDAKHSHILVEGIEKDASQKIQELRLFAKDIRFQKNPSYFKSLSAFASNHFLLDIALNAQKQVELFADERLDVHDDLIVKNAQAGAALSLGGKNIHLHRGVLESTSSNKGGEIHIGGKGSHSPTKRLIIHPEVTLKVNSQSSGSAGKIILWSEENTRFLGHIEAKGLGKGGDGGFVEVSSRNALQYLGTLDVSASQGNNGTLFLDPANIFIKNQGDDDGFLPHIQSSDGGSGDFYLSSDALMTQLKTAHVSLASTGDIYLKSSLSSPSLHSLTLNAGGRIIVEGEASFHLGGRFTLSAKDGIAISSTLIGEQLIRLEGDSDGDGVGALRQEAGFIDGAKIELSGSSVGSETQGIRINYEHLASLDDISGHSYLKDVKDRSNVENELKEKETVLEALNKRLDAKIVKAQRAFKAHEKKVAKKVEKRRQKALAKQKKAPGLNHHLVKKAMKEKKPLLLGAGDIYALSFRYGKNKDPKPEKRVINIGTYLNTLAR